MPRATAAGKDGPNPDALMAFLLLLLVAYLFFLVFDTPKKKTNEIPSSCHPSSRPCLYKYRFLFYFFE
jgi:hypothetical protein